MVTDYRFMDCVFCSPRSMQRQKHTVAIAYIGPGRPGLMSTGGLSRKGLNFAAVPQKTFAHRVARVGWAEYKPLQAYSTRTE